MGDLSGFRVRAIYESNGLVVLHMEHVSGHGRTKRRFADYDDMRAFIHSNRVRIAG